MNKPNKGGRRVSRNSFTTKSGANIKINRGLSARLRASREAKSQRRAERLIGMPKSRLKRFFYRLQPRRLANYWFSREGGIMALKLLGIGIIAGFLLLVGLFAYFRKDLPNLRDISGDNIGGSMRYMDRTGKTLLWEDYDAVKRIPVEDKDIAQNVKDATVAIEDKDFFKHGGFDVRGIARAGVNNVFGKSGSTQGGSTITQQLVKLTQNWSKQQTYTRKVKELILAVELERSYSKQEILTGYLNTAPYGGIEYGVEAASRDYFQKSAKDLTLSEATMLAAIPKSPRYYSPYSADFEKDALIGRQHYILDQMYQQGMITKAQRDEAKGVDVIAQVKPRKPKYDGIKAPWFVLAAKKQLEDKFGDQTVKRGGWTVITTLDTNLQSIAEDQVNKGLAQVRRQGGDVAAFAAEDVKTGQMVALVGGSDFSNPDYGQINYAQTPLPPGSSFKAYDYSALIESSTNFGAGSVLYDTQSPLEGYPCTNKALPKQGGNCLYDYDFRYPGPLTLRYALGGSRNVPAVKAMLTVGVNKTIDIAEKMGLKSGYKCYLDDALTKEGPCYASSAIGDGAYLHLDEHVHGYSTISRNGVNLPQTYILKITDSGGKKVDEWKPTKGDQAIRPDAAYIVADMLSDPNASYFPAGRKPHRFNTKQGTWKFAMKTGTTNDGKDGWMMGFSTQYAAGVWVGYHTRRVVMRGTMESMTQPIWQGWMDKAHENLTPVDRQKPSDLQTLPAFVVRSHVGLGSVEPTPSTDLYPAWYKQTKATNNKKQTIDIISNKLATDCTPPLARKDQTDATADSFSGDIFQRGQADTSSNDDVHKCEDVKPGINFDPGSKSATLIQGTHPLSGNGDKGGGKVTFSVNGQVIQSYDIDGRAQYTLTSTGGLSGNQDVTATVIDSVLYTGTDTQTVNFSSSSDELTITNANSGGGTISFNWTGGSGLVSILLDGTSSPALCSDTDGSCSRSGSLPGGSKVYAKDQNGNVSDPVSVH